MGARVLYIMDCGGAEADYDILVAFQHPGEKVILPFSACLIDTDDGPVLVETGINPAGLRNPVEAAGERASAMKFILRKEDDIRARLKEIGLKPGDVRTVILSHMHWDHTGGCKFFPHATLWCSEPNTALPSTRTGPSGSPTCGSFSKGCRIWTCERVMEKLCRGSG